MVTAISGVVLMFAWVIIPPLEQAFDMYSSSGVQADTVLTWRGGNVSENQMHAMRASHNVAVSFLRGIVARTQERGGQPQAAGLRMGQRGEIEDPGIPADSSEAALVQTMLLAEKAQEMGIKVDQTAVKEFLSQLSAYTLQEGDWLEVAQLALPDSGMSVRQLFAQLETELLAQHMRMVANSGLYSLPPGEIWDYHNRLNRRVQIEALPITVANFKSQTGQPSDAELQELFKKGKDRDPNPAFPEPGFHKPQEIAFGYFRVDFKPFLDDALKTIPQDDPRIEQEYKTGVSQGKFKVLDLPEEKPADPKLPAADPSAKPDETKPGETKPGETKPGDAKPAEAKPDDAKPAEGKPADAKSDSKAEDSKAEGKKSEPAKDADKSAADSKDATPDEKKDCQEAEAQDNASKDKAKSGDEAPAAKAADKKSSDEKTDEKPDDAKPAEPKADDAKPADSKPDGAKPGDSKTDEAKPGDAKPGDAKPSDAKPAEPKKEPKFKPLDEVRDEIRNSLAQPIAEDARKAAVKAATDAVSEYGRKYRRWQAVKGQKSSTSKATDPGKLDIEAIAKKHQLVAGTTPLVDPFELQEYEIGTKAFFFDMQAGGISGLAEMAYRSEPVLFQPTSMLSSDAESSYLVWPSQYSPAADVKFDDVKPQVIDAWKTQKAFELAKAEAKKLADKAAGAKSLKAVAGDPTKVIEPPPFSWLTTGGVARGMGGEVSLSSVPGVELAGREFMEAIFALKPNEAGVAPNQSHAIVYVVRVTRQEPSDEQLRSQFLETGLTFEVMRIAQEERRQTSAQWYEDLLKEMKVEWQRPPRASND